jgi:hypothetical protein
MVTSLLALALVAAAPVTEADRLFAEGKRLLAERPAEACPLFQKSFELDPALGTLLNLALCFEKTDRPASAWLRFNEAREWALRTHEMDRERAAKEHVDALAPKLSWVALVAARPMPGLVVEVGAHKLSLATASSVPVDPGMFEVRATAPGFRPWQKSVFAPPPGQSVNVLVPELESLTPDPVAVSDRPTVVAPPPAVITQSVPQETEHPTRAPGAVLLGTGAAVAVFGIVSLAYSVEVYSRAQAQRLDGTMTGPPTVTRAEFDTASTLYPTSIVAMAVGIAAAGVGTWLFVRSPSAVTVGAAPLPGGAAVVAGGAL